MRVERLGQDKIRFFITFDDLMERGIEKEDMWRDIPKVHELFNDMMEHAYAEVGFEANGPVAVEVFALPAQGMVVIVTKGSRDAYEAEEFDLEDLDEEVYELEVTLEESRWILYAFADMEDAIAAAHAVRNGNFDGGSLYTYQGRYYLYFPEENEWPEEQVQRLTSLLSEYGEASTSTPYVIAEYGKCVIAERAIDTICLYFSSR